MDGEQIAMLLRSQRVQPATQFSVITDAMVRLPDIHASERSWSAAATPPPSA